MAKHEKKYKFGDIVKTGLNSFFKIISKNILSQIITNGSEKAVNNIEDRIMKVEKRIFRDTISLLIIGFGGVFLIFALFFLLKEFLDWSNSAAFFSIGIIAFVIGLLLIKLGDKNGNS